MATEFICAIRASGASSPAPDYTSFSSWVTACSCNLTTSSNKVFSHGGITGTVGDGASVTGQTSGATGTVYHATTSQIFIAVTSGTFSSGEVVQVSAGNSVTISDAGDTAHAVAEAYDDWASGLDDELSLTSFTANSANYVIVRAATGQQHDGTAGGSGFFISSSNTGNVHSVNSNQYSKIQGIKVRKQSGTWAYGRLFNWFNPSSGKVITFENCFGIVETGASVDAVFYASSANNAIAYFYNPIAVTLGTGTATFGVYVKKEYGNSGTDESRVMNASVNGDFSSFGVYGTKVSETANPSILVKNSVVANQNGSGSDFGFGTSFSNTDSGFAYNISTDTSAGSSNNNQSSVSESGMNFNSAPGDLTITSGSSLIDQGADLSSYFTDDAIGAARGATWDVGAFEYVAAGGATSAVPSLNLTLAPQAPTTLRSLISHIPTL